MYRFLAITVLLAFVASLATVIAQDSSSVRTEVRINAHQLDDGRIEFAVQQREGDGWAERMLAQRRYLPANVSHSRWLNSSPYSVTVAGAATSASIEVRISARQLDDRRVEFALQQRESDGWGERMLAQRRYLPANVGHRRWLNSSAFSVSVDLVAPEPAMSEEKANAESEHWEWFGVRSNEESTFVGAGWWRASVRGTYTGRDVACIPSLSSHERRPGGDPAFSVSAIVRPLRTIGTGQVFKAGPDGDAEIGWFRARVSNCDHATFVVRSATQKEIDEELERREREESQRQSSDERRRQQEERRQARNEWIAAWSPSGDLCDPGNENGVLTRTAVGFFDQSGEEAVEWATAWASESVVFCQESNDPFAGTYSPTLPTGSYRAYITGEKSGYINCNLTIDEALQREDRGDTGGWNIHSSFDAQHPQDEWRVYRADINVGEGWDRTNLHLLPGEMWVWPDCGSPSVVIIERVVE